VLAKVGKAMSAATGGGGGKKVAGPDASGAYPKGTCAKCDGPHLTDACPIYKKKRDDHPDAWRNFGRKTPLGMGTYIRAHAHTCVHMCAQRNVLSRGGAMFAPPHCPPSPVAVLSPSSTSSFFWPPFPLPTCLPHQDGCSRWVLKMRAHGIWCCVTGKGGGNFKLKSAKVIRQPGDGNCLFHSMSYGLGASERVCVRVPVCFPG